MVADSLQAGGMGGTLATQATWSMQAQSVKVIDLAQLGANPAHFANAPVDERPARVRAPLQNVVGGGRTIKSLLFADVKGFSHLAEVRHKLVRFFTHGANELRRKCSAVVLRDAAVEREAVGCDPRKRLCCVQDIWVLVVWNRLSRGFLIADTILGPELEVLCG